MALPKRWRNFSLVLAVLWAIVPGVGPTVASSPRDASDQRPPANSLRGDAASIASKDPPFSAAPQDESAELNRRLVAYTEQLATFTRWLVYATMLLAVIAAIQVGSSLFLAVRQLRAYVVVATGDLFNVAAPPPPPAGQPPAAPTLAAISNPNLGPIAILTTKNTGQTVAHNVTVWASIAVREWPLTANLPGILPGAPVVASTSILGPGIATTQVRNLAHPLTPQEVADLRAGTSAIYVWGEITYRDIFHRRRFVRFRTYQHSSIGVLGVSTTLNFMDTGNEAN